MNAPCEAGYAERIQRAVDYIETDLSREVALDEAAARACWSSFHFMRTFTAVIGATFREYLRTRRMDLAAYRLSFSDERVLDIAVSVGYETHEAFTRAFKKIYGVSPGRYRTIGTYTMRAPRACVVLKRYETHGRDDMEPRIVKKGAMTIMGAELRTTNDGSNLKEIPEFWERFLTEGTAERIPDKVEPAVSYGLCTDMDSKSGAFSYVIGYAVPDGTPATNRFGTFPVPSKEYAVFTARAKTGGDDFSNEIQRMWKFAYGEWFVDNPTWERDDGPDFELYDDRRFSESEAQCDIYIPVRRR